MTTQKTTNYETKLMTQTEAAIYLGTTVGTLNTWRNHSKKDENQKKIPYVKWGRCIRYRREDLDTWVESQTVNKQQ